MFDNGMWTIGAILLRGKLNLSGTAFDLAPRIRRAALEFRIFGETSVMAATPTGTSDKLVLRRDFFRVVHHKNLQGALSRFQFEA